MIIGIDGLIDPIPQSEYSHKRGQALIMMSQLKYAGFDNVEIVTGTDIDKYDMIIIDLGMEFKGTLNVFGGMNEKKIDRLKRLIKFSNAGVVVTVGHDFPNLVEFAQKRKFDLPGAENLWVHKCDAIMESDKLILGDSHANSVYRPGFEIQRLDGKTMHGAIKEKLISSIPKRFKEVVLYFGNIDIRHHLCRFMETDLDLQPLTTLVDAFFQEIDVLTFQREIKITVVCPLFIPNDSRKLPLTGYYKDTPFFGSWTQREFLRASMIGMFMKECNLRKMDLFHWEIGMTNEHQELDIEYMERPQSVHLAPKYYPYMNEQIVPKKEKKVRVQGILPRTPYFEGFVEYYKRAAMLQERNLEGIDHEDEEINDPLMLEVPIYNNVNRRYAGFSNMLEDLWYGDKAPKGKSRKEYNCLREVWTEFTWMWVMMLHRITGSGASFMKDHGYRNTILPQLTAFSNVEEMVAFIKNYEEPMFTSIGNQIPMFPKPNEKYAKGSKLYICEYMTDLVSDVYTFMKSANDNGLKRKTIRSVVDFCTNWHGEHSLKKFHFQLTAFAMDMAEYFPQYVDRQSGCYVGKNCLEAFKLCFDGNVNKIENQDMIFCITREHIGDKSNPYDLEDVFCDYIRYIENYLPQKGYESQQTYLLNNSIVKDHHKGRQLQDGVIVNLGS